MLIGLHLHVQENKKIIKTNNNKHCNRKNKQKEMVYGLNNAI